MNFDILHDHIVQNDQLGSFEGSGPGPSKDPN